MGRDGTRGDGTGRNGMNRDGEGRDGAQSRKCYVRRKVSWQNSHRMGKTKQPILYDTAELYMCLVQYCYRTII